MGQNRTWATVLLVIIMAGAAKAGMHFIRLVVLAAAGLAGLILLHILASDYRKIQASRPKAFGLFKRSISDDGAVLGADIDTMYSSAHQRLEELNRIQHLDNSVSLLSAAVKMDPLGCAQRYICTIAASPTKTISSLDTAILQMIEAHKDAPEFKVAMQLGQDLDSPKQCSIHYPRCTFSITEMLRLIQPVY